MQVLIRKHKFGKSADLDDICAEALKCAHNELPVLLSLYCTLFISHGYLPSTLIEITIVPIAKDKYGNISGSKQPSTDHISYNHF